LNYLLQKYTKKQEYKVALTPIAHSSLLPCIEIKSQNLNAYCFP
jgi:hypothetical protein